MLLHKREFWNLSKFFGENGSQISGKTRQCDLNSPHELKSQILTYAMLQRLADKYEITYQNIWGEFFRFLWLCVDLEILIRNTVRIEILKIMNKQYHRSSSFAKRTVLDVWQGSEYASIISNIRVINWLIIYWSLLCQGPKCPLHEGKLVPRTIQFGIYYSPISINIHKVQMLAENACRNISIVL